MCMYIYILKYISINIQRVPGNKCIGIKYACIKKNAGFNMFLMRVPGAPCGRGF